jgi:hypothetical protein
MAVEIIILQGSTLSCMIIQSLAHRDATERHLPVTTYLQKISCQGSQSDTPAMQDHLVFANYVAATESELAQTCKRLLDYYQPKAHHSH